MAAKKHIIVYSFQSLEDPLVKGLMLQYLISMSQSQTYFFHLITHEQKNFELNNTQKDERIKELEQQNISWYPVKYHTGKFLMLKKLFDFIKAAFICAKIRLKFKAKVIIGFLPIASGYSAILAPVLNLKLITYCFEPHSEYMADFKIWSRQSLKYVLLRKYEMEQIQISKSLIVPTNYTSQFVEKINPYAKKYVFPISVDTDKNIFDASFRNEFREKRKIQNKKVILYLGKFGGIYYDIPGFIDFLYKFRTFPQYHALIISPDADKINSYLTEQKYDLSFFTILNFIPYDEIHKYISCADLGVVAVPVFPSQKYRTPVKTGLYLSCGIPYLINKGIAEDDLIAIREKVGVAVTDILNTDMVEMDNAVNDLLKSEKLAERCRNVAVKYRSHTKAVEVLEKVLEDIYI